MKYSLYQFFEEAHIEPIPEWFRHIELWFYNPATGRMEPGKPMWHQVTGLNLILSHTRSALFDEMGTGKTAPAQAATLWHVEQGARVVCLMPPILIKQFLDAYKETFRDLPPTIRIETYHANQRKREKQAIRWRVEGPPHIVLTTYQMFAKESTLFQEHNFEYILADECKLLSSPSTDVFNAVEGFLGKYGEKGLLMMNGTPAFNQPLGLYGYIHLLTPWMYASIYDFETQHVIYKSIQVSYRDAFGNDRKRSVDKIDAYMGKDVIFKNLYLQARRVETKDVQELPPLTIIPTHVELSEKHEKVYKQFVKERILLLPDGVMINGIHASALRQKCAQAVVHPEDLGVHEESAVIIMAEQLFDQIDLQANKVVVFCYYQRTVEAMAERWKGYNPAIIYGGQTVGKNEKGRVKFINDESCRLGIINYDSGGVGLNLQRNCHDIITIETTSVPGSHSQAMKRVHRTGQKLEVRAYIIIAKSTIQVAQYRDMTDKQREIDETVSRDRLEAELLGDEERLVAEA